MDSHLPVVCIAAGFFASFCSVRDLDRDVMEGSIGDFEQGGYNGSMEKKNQTAVTAEFYEEYAKANSLDSLQLCLLDMLYQASGGPMTWIALQKALDCPRSRLLRTVMELADQTLVEYTGDLVRLTFSAPFMIEEVIEDLHSKFDQYARIQNDDYEVNLMA